MPPTLHLPPTHPWPCLTPQTQGHQDKAQHLHLNWLSLLGPHLPLPLTSETDLTCPSFSPFTSYIQTVRTHQWCHFQAATSPTATAPVQASITSSLHDCSCLLPGLLASTLTPNQLFSLSNQRDLLVPHFHALEKEMATHFSILAWRIPGTQEPGGLPSMGSHRVGRDWSDLAAAIGYATLSLKILQCRAVQ